MTEQNLLELAKQGDPRAIAAVMNYQLQSKGMTTKAAMKDGWLQIMVESDEVPDQHSALTFIRKALISLGSPSIDKVKVYGRRSGEHSPIWNDEFELAPQDDFMSSVVSPDTNFNNGFDSGEVEEEYSPYAEDEDNSYVNEEEIEPSAPPTKTKSNPLAGGIQGLKTASTKVKLLALAGLAAIVALPIIAFALLNKPEQTEVPVATETPVRAKPKNTPATTQKPATQPKATTAAVVAKPKTTPTVAPKATPKPQPVAAVPAKAKPAQTTQPKANIDIFQRGVNNAEVAAKLTQTAKTKSQWNAVAGNWQEAINVMKSVPQSHPRYKLAQERVGAYQKNLAYAQKAASLRK